MSTQQASASKPTNQVEEMQVVASLLDRITDESMRRESEQMLMDRAQAYHWRKTPVGKDPDESQMKIAAGRAFGLDAWTSMNCFDVIQGQVAPKAVFRHARMQVCGYDVIVKEHTLTACTLVATKADKVITTADGQPYSITYTMEDAKKAGLDSKDNYKKNPMDMLWARAITRVQKRVCPAAMLGMDLPDPSEPITMDRIVTATEERIAAKTGDKVEALSERLQAEKVEEKVIVEVAG